MAGEFTTEALLARFGEINRRLDEIDDALVAMSEKTGVPFARTRAEAPKEVTELARAGKTMEAMKLYREMTGGTMEEARKVVGGQ